MDPETLLDPAAREARPHRADPRFVPGTPPAPGTLAAVFVAVANVFLIAFVTDAAVSMLEEALRALTGTWALAGARNAIAYLALALALPAFLVTAISPQVPARLLVPLQLLLVWFALGAAPLGLLVAPEWGGVAVAGLQLGAAGAALLWVRTRSGSGRFWLRAGQRGSAELSGWRAFGFASIALVLCVPVGLAYLVLLALTWLETGTQGFLQVGLNGISIAERRYVQEGRRIDLVGMMHLGNPEAYAALYHSFATPSTVVLEEGVSDRDRRLDNRLGYGRAAAALGLAAQPAIEHYFEEAWQEEGVEDEEARWPRIWHADLDAADFSEETLAFLERAAELWNAPDLASALAELLELSREPVDLPVVLDDLMVSRNEYLLLRLDEALLEYDRIVVPWGALHLAAIEAALHERGFVQTTESTRELVSWRRLLAGFGSEPAASH